MQNAMIIDPKDNVAVAIEPIAAGDTVTSVSYTHLTLPTTVLV